MNTLKHKYDDAMPVTDEGWWQSVLADEQRYAPPHPQHGHSSKPKPVMQEKQAAKTEPVPAVELDPAADWETVKELYSKDRIINMKVTGHNRGGLPCPKPICIANSALLWKRLRAPSSIWNKTEKQGRRIL